MLLTQQGQMVRTPVKDIREAGRNTQGVKLINLTAGDKLREARQRHQIQILKMVTRQTAAAEFFRRRHFYCQNWVSEIFFTATIFATAIGHRRFACS
jgi:hypothetical protein